MMGLNLNIERDIVKLVAWPQDAAPAPAMPVIEPTRQRDLIALTDNVDQQRDLAAAQIDHAAGQLEATLALIESLSPDVDTDLVRGQITDSLSTLASMRDQIHAAHPALLANIIQSIPQAVATAQSAGLKATREAEKEENLIVGDVTVEMINDMTISAMADKLTAAHFAQMTTEQLDAVRAKTDQTLAKANQEGKAVDAMLDQSQEASEAYRTMRDQLQAEEEEARRSGNRQELARIEAMQSANREVELREQGMHALADQEAERGSDIRDAARLIAREEAARKVMRQQDMTPEEKTVFIEAAETEAMAKIETGLGELAVQRASRGETVEQTAGYKMSRNLEWVGNQTQGQSEEAEREETLLGQAGAFAAFSPSSKSGLETARKAAEPIATGANIILAEIQPEHEQDIQKPIVAGVQPKTTPQMTV